MKAKQPWVLVGHEDPVEQSLYWICWHRDLEQHKIITAISAEELFPTRKAEKSEYQYSWKWFRDDYNYPLFMKKAVLLYITKFLFTEEIPSFPGSLRYN